MGRYMREELTEQGNNTRRNMYSFIIEFITTHGYSPNCQKCGKYRPRIRVKYINRKKEKLEKIRKEERY